MCDVKTGTCDCWSLGQTRSLIALCIYKLISVDVSLPHRPCLAAEGTPLPRHWWKCDGNRSVSTSNDRFISVCFANTEAQTVSGFWSLALFCRFVGMLAFNANLFPACSCRQNPGQQAPAADLAASSQGETESKQQSAS